MPGAHEGEGVPAFSSQDTELSAHVPGQKTLATAQVLPEPGQTAGSCSAVFRVSYA